MRIAAGTFAGKDSTRRRFRAAAVRPTWHSASAYKPQEITERSDIGPLDHRKLKPLVDDARRRIARCRAGRRELTESWESNVAIMSHEADECAAQQGTGREARYQHWQASYHRRPLGQTGSMMKIADFQQLTLALRLLARAKLRIADAVPSKHSSERKYI